MGKYKKGDNIPVVLGDYAETYLLVLSYDGDSYEVQIKERRSHEKDFRYGRFLRLTETDIEELREK